MESRIHCFDYLRAHARNLHAVIAFIAASTLFHGLADATHAQLSRDVRSVFEGMLDEVEPDLRKKLREAIDNNSNTIELTPDQFKRFRANPINPFEGLDEIDADSSPANIALKFELSNMRNRRVSNYERQTPLLISKLGKSVGTAAQSTVRVMNKKNQLALGVVVREDGFILTKASELENTPAITCELPSGQKLPATKVTTDVKNDLALLKVNSTNMRPIRFSSRPVAPGTFLLSPDRDGSVIAMGTYSVTPRSTLAGKQAFLGVKPETTATGVRVTEVDPGNASYEAGLANGDVIIRLGGKRITDVSSLVNSIRDHRPGDSVEIEFIRNGQAAKTNAVLAARHISARQAARFKMMNGLGAEPSKRDDHFPVVFQHDTPLFPEHCGGPIVDLDGNVLGINIARKGRAATFAIPSAHVETLIRDFLSAQANN